MVGLFFLPFIPRRHVIYTPRGILGFGKRARLLHQCDAICQCGLGVYFVTLLYAKNDTLLGVEYNYIALTNYDSTCTTDDRMM